mgnify:CR=1 FL=1
MSFDFAAAAITSASAGSRVSVKDLSVEEARAHVKVVDGNIKKPVEGFQGLTLKLGRVKISMDALAPKAIKIQVADEQVEEVSALMLARVEAGDLDAAIEEGLTKLNAVAAPKAAEAPSEDDFEGFDEGELAADAE